jgi:hypothetical protein
MTRCHFHGGFADLCLTASRWFPVTPNFLDNHRSTNVSDYRTKAGVARFANLRVTIVLSGDADSAWDDARGRINAAMISTKVGNLDGLAIRMCGPDPMMHAVREVLVGLGVANDRIEQEVFVSPTSSEATEVAVDNGPFAEPKSISCAANAWRFVPIRCWRAPKMPDSMSPAIVVQEFVANAK